MAAIWDAQYVTLLPGTEVTIRPATAADATVAAAIYVESSNAAFRPYQPDRVLSPELTARWAADLTSEAQRWWVAELNETVVGVAGIGPSRDPVCPHVGELDTIAVRTNLWRRGVGTALIGVVNDALDNSTYAEAVLWTWRDYEQGYTFYRSAGWELTDMTRDGGRQVCFHRTCTRRCFPSS